MSERPKPISVAAAADDREHLVDLWMAAQLLIERRFYRALGKTSGRRMRLVTLLELDALTQLPDEGATAKDIATTLGVDLTVARGAVRNLVRRSLLLRERALDGRRLIRRTPQADSLIELIHDTQAGLMMEVLEKLSPDLQQGLLELMKAGTLRN
jgi:DNA-binding MarR family transcriptional regulator